MDMVIIGALSFFTNAKSMGRKNRLKRKRDKTNPKTKPNKIQHTKSKVAITVGIFTYYLSGCSADNEIWLYFTMDEAVTIIFKPDTKAARGILFSSFS